MNRFLTGIIVIMAATTVFAQTQSHTTSTIAPSSDSMVDVRRAIDRGNAQWVEGWRNGDAAMVAAIFADDGVQLSGSGKIFKGRQQILERPKSSNAGSGSWR